MKSLQTSLCYGQVEDQLNTIAEMNKRALLICSDLIHSCYKLEKYAKDSKDYVVQKWADELQIRSEIVNDCLLTIEDNCISILAAFDESAE